MTRKPKILFNQPRRFGPQPPENAGLRLQHRRFGNPQILRHRSRGFPIQSELLKRSPACRGKVRANDLQQILKHRLIVIAVPLLGEIAVGVFELSQRCITHRSAGMLPPPVADDVDGELAEPGTKGTIPPALEVGQPPEYDQPDFLSEIVDIRGRDRKPAEPVPDEREVNLVQPLPIRLRRIRRLQAFEQAGRCRGNRRTSLFWNSNSSRRILNRNLRPPMSFFEFEHRYSARFERFSLRWKNRPIRLLKRNKKLLRL